MAYANSFQNTRFVQYGLLFVASLVAVVLGLAATILPAFILVAPALSLIWFFSSVANPTIPAVSILVFSFGLLPFVPIDFRVFSELIIYGSLFVTLIYIVGDRGKSGFAFVSVYRFPLILFFIAWIVALLIGMKHNYQFANADSRRYVGLLAIFVFAVAESKKHGICIKLAISISLLAAFMLICQMLTGWRVFGGHHGYWESVSKELIDVTRGTAQGGDYLLAFSMFFCLLRASGIGGVKGSSTKYLLGATLFFLAIISTFSRGLWAGVAAGALVLPIFLHGARGRILKTLTLGILVLMVSGVGLYVIKPRLVEAVFVRVTSVANEGAKGTSVGARLDENQQAIAALQQNWIFGMGHGAEYKKFLNINEIGFANQITFIHNSYLWVALKLGLLGVCSLSLLLFSIYKQARIARERGEFEAIIGASGLGAIVVLLVTGLIAPVWAQAPDLVALSLIAVCISSVAQPKTNVYQGAR